MIEVESKIAGSLYGELVGDALGCPVEGWSSQEIQAAYGRITEMIEPQERWRPLGLHSDDGQQMLALASALLTDPLHPEEPFAQTLVRMYQIKLSKESFGLHRGTGRNFRATVQGLAKEGSSVWGAAQPSSGNGTAIMIAPLGWYFYKDLELLQNRVIQVARVKQCDVRGIAGAGSIAYLVAYAMTHETWEHLDHQGFVDFIKALENKAAEQLVHAQQLRDTTQMHTFSLGLAYMLDHLKFRRGQVLQDIVNLANQTADFRIRNPCKGYVLASVITSIYITLTNTAFENALLEMLQLGGDSDSTCAMAGAMAGALYGKDQIPARWYDSLVAKDCFDSWIHPLSQCLYPWKPDVSLETLETEWTKLSLCGPAKKTN